MKLLSYAHSQATALPVGKTCKVALPPGQIVVSFEVLSPTTGVITLTVCVTVSLQTPCATSVYVVVCVGVTLGFCALGLLNPLPCIHSKVVPSG